MSVLALSNRQMARLLSHAMAYEAVKSALICHAQGKYQQPLKPYIRPLGREDEYHGGRFIAMPSYLGDPFRTAGIKWIAGFPANVEKGIPRASGVFVLNNVETGEPVAVMECAVLSAMRTAAVAAIAFDSLAAPGFNRVAVIGAGPIAKAVIEALAEGPRNIDHVSVYDLNTKRTGMLIQQVCDHTSLAIRSTDRLNDCLSDAHVVISATTAKEAYVSLAHIPVVTLVIALSLDDFSSDVFLSAKVVVDDFDQCNREEKLLHRLVKQRRFSRERVHAELGEILIGSKPGREKPDELIYVNPMGMGIEDLAVATVVFRGAIEFGVGSTIFNE